MAFNILRGMMTKLKYLPVEHPKRIFLYALKYLMKQHVDTRQKAIAKGKCTTTGLKNNAEEIFSSK